MWSLLVSREEYGGELPLLSMSAQHGVRYRPEGEGRAASDDTSGYRVVKPGDLVINKLSARDGAYGVSGIEGLVSPAYWVLHTRTTELEPRWIDYVLRSRPYQAELGRISKSMPPAQFDLPWDRFRRVPIPVPPRAEQRAIADFLDTETTRIDALITKKRDLIGLLAEADRALVDGLFGAMYEGRTVRLARLARLQTGLTLDSARAVEAGAVTLPYLRVANVQADRLDLTEVKEVSVSPELASRCRLRSGDVLMTEGGDLDKLGRGTVWSEELPECLHQNHVFAVRPDRERLLPEFLAILTRTSFARRYFESTGTRSTNLASTNSSKVLDFRVPLVEVDRQRTVLDHYLEQAERLSKCRQVLARQIDLLVEHRQALITAAVTGELAVPGVAA